MTDQLFFLPQTQQAQLGLLQGIFGRREGLGFGWQNLVEDVPEGLRSKPFGGKAPGGSEEGLLIPSSDFGLRAGITDAVNGGEQQIMSGAWPGARSGPQRFKQRPQAGVLSGEPQGAGKSELPQGRREGHRGGAFLDEFGEFFCGAEIGLMNDTRLALDSGAFDEVVIEAMAFFLFDEAGHEG